ncbi:hypothetical protein [Parafrankia discariae]|uniref:hypothetical protein n=1 Tax=Parafrankia discariae TaxID=365528 RepID=UPI0003A9682B|nr:hypothetical protein [Parafrankia discariae]
MPPRSHQVTGRARFPQTVADVAGTDARGPWNAAHGNGPPGGAGHVVAGHVVERGVAIARGGD